MKHSQVKFKDGGFQMGKLDKRIMALIKLAPDLVNFFDQVSFSRVDGAWNLADKQQHYVGNSVENPGLPIFEEIDYQALKDSGIDRVNVLIGSGNWAFFDSLTLPADTLVLAYDLFYQESYENGEMIDFFVGQDQKQTPNVMLIGDAFDLRNIRLIQKNKITIENVIIVSPAGQSWENPLIEGLSSGNIKKATIIAPYAEPVMLLNETLEKALREGVTEDSWENNTHFTINRKRVEVDGKFPFGSIHFGPSGSRGRINNPIVWQIDVTKKK